MHVGQAANQGLEMQLVMWRNSSGGPLKLTNAETCATFLLRPAGVLLGVGPGVASTGVTGVAGTAGDAELRTEALFCEAGKEKTTGQTNELQSSLVAGEKVAAAGRNCCRVAVLLESGGAHRG